MKITFWYWLVVLIVLKSKVKSSQAFATVEMASLSKKVPAFEAFSTFNKSFDPTLGEYTFTLKVLFVEKSIGEASEIKLPP